MEVRNKYGQGRIYKITSDATHLIYIGSTTCPLSVRMSKHRYNYKKYTEGKYHRVSSFDIFAVDPKCQIVLLEEYPCGSREELVKRERHYVELHRPICVNIQVPGRKHSEYAALWYANNRQAAAARHLEWYRKNKDKLLLEKSKPITCTCGIQVTKGYIGSHLKSKKHELRVFGTGAQ